MRLLLLSLLAGAVSACSGTGTTDHSLRRTPSPLTIAQLRTGREIEAPRGFAAMCERDSRLCAQAEAGVAAPASDLAHDIKLLARVNHLVNGRVLQRTDMRIYGRDEYWAPSGIARGAQGDCEDIALEKRKQLIAAGFDPTRLSLAVAYHRRLGLHTVLLARMDPGDLVLDNREARLRPWNRTSYTWVSLERRGKPGHWAMAIDPRTIRSVRPNLALAPTGPEGLTGSY